MDAEILVLELQDYIGLPRSQRTIKFVDHFERDFIDYWTSRPNITSALEVSAETQRYFETRDPASPLDVVNISIGAWTALTELALSANELIAHGAELIDLSNAQRAGLSFFNGNLTVIGLSTNLIAIHEQRESGDISLEAVAGLVSTVLGATSTALAATAAVGGGAALFGVGAPVIGAAGAVLGLFAIGADLLGFKTSITEPLLLTEHNDQTFDNGEQVDFANVAVYRALLERIDPSIDGATAQQLLGAMSNVHARGVEALLNAIAEFVDPVPDRTPIIDNADFLGRVGALFARAFRDADGVAINLGKIRLLDSGNSAHGVRLADRIAVDELLREALTAGDAGLSARYALQNLLPFTLAAPADVFRGKHIDAELDLANFAASWFVDRAQLLTAKATVNVHNVSPAQAFVPGWAHTQFADLATGETFVVNGALNSLLPQPPMRIVFGSLGNDDSDSGLVGSSGRDRIYAGLGDDFVEGGAGDDLLSGDAGDDTLLGGAGADVLLGGRGRDRLVGGAGADALEGGDGADQLELGESLFVGDGSADTAAGGRGDDHYWGLSGGDVVVDEAGDDVYFVTFRDSTPDALPGGIVQIADEDGRGAIFASPGAQLTGGNLVGQAAFGLLAIYESVDGLYRYRLVEESDGTRVLTITSRDADGQIVIRNFLPNSLGIILSNSIDLIPDLATLLGDAASDVLLGTQANDEIRGLAGDDTISGNGGRDLIDAGSGDDRVDGGLGDDVIIGGSGDDRLVGSDGADVIDGGDGTDLLSGLAGNDMLDGGAGDDVIGGGAGSDELRGGEGADLLVANAAFGAFNPAWSATRQAPSLDSNAFRDPRDYVFEGLALDLLAFNDPNLVANAPANSLFGNDGADDLIGGSGSDLLEGGAGNDNALGAAGDDALNGGSGDDHLQGNSGNDILIGAAGDDFLVGFGALDEATDGDDTLFGGSGDDRIFGEAPGVVSVTGNDTLYGGDGNDQLVGNLGNDTLHGDAGNDVLFGDDDRVANRGGNDTVDGGSGDDQIEGGIGDDHLVGGSGRDTIIGDDHISAGLYHGIDVIDGGDGDDIIDGRGGADFIGGGDGDDIIFGDEDASHRLAAQFHGNDVIDGGRGNDSIFGDGGDDTLAGAEGDDLILGGAGNDIIAGGPDDDRLFGEDGQDAIQGDAGHDFIAGGADADIVSGGFGDDEIHGGDGNDVLAGDAGADAILGEAGDDALSGGSGDDQLFGGAGDDTLDGGDDSDFLNGEAGDDTLLGGRGFDTLVGDVGSDTLDGGAGRDTISGGPDLDFIVGGAGSDFIEGGAGNDRIDGGSGHDQLLYQDIAQHDVISGALGFDLARVMTAPSSTVEISLSGDSLRIAFGFGDTLTLAGWSTASVLDAIVFSDGVLLTSEDFLTQTAPGRLFEHNASGATVNGTHGNDVFRLTGRDFSLAGGAGNDAYFFSIGNGAVSVVDTQGFNDFVFDDDIVLQDLAFALVQFDLKISRGADSLTIGGWDSGATRRFIFSDGMELERSAIESLLERPPPVVAIDDSIALGEDESFEFDPRVNDRNSANGAVAVIAVSSASHGRVEITSEQQIVYTPKSDFFGNDSFTYTIRDIYGNTASAQVRASVASANDAPTISGPLSAAAAFVGEAFKLVLPATLFADDFDPILDIALTQTDASPLPAWLNFNASSGELSGIPVRGSEGGLNILVTATDTLGLAATVNLTIDVLPGIDARETALFDPQALDGRNGFFINGFGADDTNERYIARAGDLNNDGIDDLFLQTGEDRASVIFGRLGGFTTAAELTLGNAGDGFELSGFVGANAVELDIQVIDANNDEKDDIVIGGLLSGRVLLGATSFATALDFAALPFAHSFAALMPRASSLIPGQIGAIIGSNSNAAGSPRSVGDINGDGVGDFALEFNKDNGGGAWVVFGEPLSPREIDLGSLDGSRGFLIDGFRLQAHDTGLSQFYNPVGLGDINGDGFDDLGLGLDAELFDITGPDINGLVAIVFGNAGGYDGHLNLIDLDGSNGFLAQTAALLGGHNRPIEARRLGDINGDGLADVLVHSDHNKGQYVVYGAARFGGSLHVGTPIDDTIIVVNPESVYAGGGNDTITILTGGNFTVHGGSGNNTFNVGAGAPLQGSFQPGATITIRGGSGSNTYVVRTTGAGTPIIRINDPPVPGSAGGNRLVLPGIESARLNLGIGSLKLHIDGDFPEIHLENFDPQNALGNNRDIDIFEFSDGDFSFEQIIARGFDIEGTAGNDVRAGTNGLDRFHASTGDDQLEGGAGDDVYYVGSGFGHDQIRDHAGTDTVVVSGAPPELLNYAAVGDDLVIRIASADSITIKSWYSDANARVEWLRFGDAEPVSLSTLANRPPRLLAPLDDQRIEPGEPLHLMTAHAFTDDDVEDILLFDAAVNAASLPTWLTLEPHTGLLSAMPEMRDVGVYAVEVVARDPELAHAAATFELVVAATAGAIALTEADDSYVADRSSDDLLTIFALQGNDSITGAAGNDRIFGGTGDDTLVDQLGDNWLDAGPGNDRITSGDGDDVFIFHRGDGRDRWSDAGGVDRVLWGPGIMPADIAIENSGLDLILKLSDADAITVSDWYAAEQHRLETFIFADGTVVAAAAFVNRAPVSELIEPIVAVAGTAFVLPLGAARFSDPDPLDILTFELDRLGTLVLPNWLHFAPTTGVLSGLAEPGDIGTLGFTIAAFDAAGAHTRQNFILKMEQPSAPLNHAPVVADVLGPQHVTAGQGFSWQVAESAFFDVDVHDQLTYSAAGFGRTALPPWLNFDAVSRAFSGTPPNDAFATYDIELVATDSAGERASQAFELRVNPVGNLIIGTAARDVLFGTEFTDVVRGLAGADRITTLGGADWVDGGAGDDIIAGGDGRNVVDGGRGHDDIVTGQHADFIEGGEGHDRIFAGAGDDVIFGGAHDDWIDAGSGENVVDGGAGRDTIIAGDGNDEIDGGIGSDVIDAGNGSNTVFGNKGDDHIITGAGADFVDAGEGNDTVVAGAGNDRIFGGAHNDILLGGDGDNAIYAGAGNDYVVTLAGDDLIDGGIGRDVIDAGDGNNIVHGGGGADYLRSGQGDDTILGGAGNDTISSGGGTDFVDGGAGSDRYEIADGTGLTRIRDTHGSEDRLIFCAVEVQPDDLWFSQSDDDLVLDIVGSRQRVLVEDWFGPRAPAIEFMQVASGTQIAAAGVNLLVQAMAQFGAPSASATALETDVADVLAPVLAAAWEAAA